MSLMKMSVQFELDMESSLDTNFPLHHATILGNISVVRHLIEDQNYSVNQKSFDLVTPLHQACLHGQLDIVKLLLDKGAIVNARNIDGATPLCDACCHGNLDVVKLLLLKGADINPKLLMSSPLHEAVIRDNIACVHLLLKAGANVEANDCHYGTPLHIAAFKGHKRCADILLRAGADVNRRQFHKMPIHDVARLQDTEFLSLLLDHGADVYSRDTQGFSPRDLVPSSTSPAKHLLLNWEVTVRSLHHLCRLVIRRELKKNRHLLHIDHLCLPKFLQDYVAFR